jgi:decaprenylphospho-beta-D-erythro-pentofuranosid-2-ulose 2-reductase
MSMQPSQRVLLLGGTSEIGLAIVRRLAQAGPVAAYLLGRDETSLARAAAELPLGDVGYAVLDALDVERHDEAIAAARDALGGIDVVIIAVGVLGGQAGLDADRREAVEVMRVNFLGAGSLLLAAMRALRAQGRGTVVVLSSVAAERPRAGNAIYGAAKAGFDSLAQGLADATAGDAPNVLVVRPGFVRTRMTAGLKAAPFAATADEVAAVTVRALDGRTRTVWVPGLLRYVFAGLRHVPRPIYRRLPL